MTGPRRGEAGVTLTELLVATGITLAVAAGIFLVVTASEAAFQAQPEMADMQQRLRVAVDLLTRDLLAAGSGIYSGPRSGGLVNSFAPIVPARVGGVGSDPPGTVRNDAISVVWVPQTCAQTTLGQPLSRTSSEFTLSNEAGCPPTDQTCCFRQDMQGIVFDQSGTWSSFVVTAVQPAALQVRRFGPDLTRDYDSGAVVAEAVQHTYYLKADEGTDTYQLMRYDGDQTDLPLVDNVVGLDFAYYGEPLAPVLIRPASDTVGPWTTYGPKPPPLGVSFGTGYPNGENCTFAVVAGQHVPRLPDLGAAGGGLVKLERAMLTDGPWCPGVASPARFDADLLRIRRVQVTLRVQAGLKQLRGPAGPLFAKPGYARGGEMFVPDHELRVDVTPRNLNLAR